MPTMYAPLDLVQNELRNAKIQNLASAPASPVAGQLYFDSVGKILYWWSGTQWVAAQGGAGAVPSDTVTTAAIGDAPVQGVSALYSRGDHKHGMPAFAAPTAETTFGTSSAAGSAATLARSDHTHGNPVHDAAAHSAIPLSALAVPTASINLNGQKLINVADPTAATDGANKQYVDGLISGITWKSTCRVATTTNLAALSGLIAVDGVTVAANDRVLVKNQTTQTANGIYVAASGAWTRATDADAGTELVDAAVYVSEGSTQADTAWVQTANAPITVGSTNLVFVQFSGPNTFSAGNGLTLTGNVFDVVAGDTSLTVAADSIVVNTGVIATVASVTAAVTGMVKKYAAALAGNVAYATGEVVTHNLNTRDIAVTVVNGASPYQAVEVDWEATTVNTVTLRYNPNLGAGYRVVVTG